MSNLLDTSSWELFPAIVAGFELHGRAASRLSAMTDLPEWFSILREHQVGGYACHHRSVAGVVLRLVDNRVFLRDPTRLLQGFARMGGDFSVERKERDWDRLSFTGGQEYSADDLSHLYQFLNECGSFPPLKTGVEAMVEFDVPDPLRCFNGWRMYSVGQQQAGTTKAEGDAWLPEHCFSEDHAGQLEVIEELLNAQLAEENRWELGDFFDAAVPGTFLLWMNSD